MPILAERYQLADVVYSDAWVVAYRAQDTLLHRDVTVELLRPECADGTNDERLLAKGRLAALTSLPYVAAIYDQGTVDGRPFLVLEEPLGPPLADSVPLEPGPAIALVESLAQTQRSALRRQQTIPALTPWTIRLSGDGRVQILDLGLAQEQPSDDAAVRQLGRLLDCALGPGGPASELRDIAARAAVGTIPTHDELLSELRSARGAPKTTDIMPREDTAQRAAPPKGYASQVHARPSKPYTAARAYAASDAPTAAVRRQRPAARSGGIVLLGLAVALLVAIGAALASGLPEQVPSLASPSIAVVASTDAPSAQVSGAPTAEVSAAPASPGLAVDAPAASAQPSATPAETYVVSAIGSPPQVRLREGPGTGFRRIGALPNGTVVQIIDGPVPADNYTWVHVRSGTQEGWCILEALKRQ